MQLLVRASQQHIYLQLHIQLLFLPQYFNHNISTTIFHPNISTTILPYKFNYLIKIVSLIQYKDSVPVDPNLINEGDEIVRACDRHRNETVTLWKHVTKYKYMRKWMDGFLNKFQSYGIKFAHVNSIHMNKSFNLFYFTMCRCSRWRHQEDSFSNEATYNQ